MTLNEFVHTTELDSTRKLPNNLYLIYNNIVYSDISLYRGPKGGSYFLVDGTKISFDWTLHHLRYQDLDDADYLIQISNKILTACPGAYLQDLIKTSKQLLTTYIKSVKNTEAKISKLQKHLDDHPEYLV